MYLHPCNHPVGFGNSLRVTSAPTFGRTGRVEEDPLTPTWKGRCILNGGDPPDSKLLWQTVNGLLEAQRAAGNITAAQESTFDAQIFNSEADAVGDVDITVTKPVPTIWWAVDEGTTDTDNRLVEAAIDSRFTMMSRDGFSTITKWEGFSSFLCGSFPSFHSYTAMTTLDIRSNAFAGELLSLANCGALAVCYLHTNSFTGTAPSFAACTALRYLQLHNNGFTGSLMDVPASLYDLYIYSNAFSNAIPDLSHCTVLIKLYAYDNAFDDYTANSLDTQTIATILDFHDNALLTASVDAILADCRQNEDAGNPARTPNLRLDGTNMELPTDSIDYDYLEAEGWTVTVTGD